MAENWIERESRHKVFQLEEAPELLHIIHSGFENLFIVFHSNGYDGALDHNAKLTTMKKEEILENYNIKIEFP